MDIALYRELRKQSNVNVAIQAILSAKGAREIHREKDDDSVLVCHKSDEEVIRTFSYVWRKKEKEVEQLYLDFRTKVKSFNDFIAESKAILEDGGLKISTTIQKSRADYLSSIRLQEQCSMVLTERAEWHRASSHLTKSF